MIACQGLFNGYERILGPGSFTGSGTYEALPDGSGTCLRNFGTGTLDYGLAPVEGDCVTVPVTTAVFVAQVSLVRFNAPGSNRLLP